MDKPLITQEQANAIETRKNLDMLENSIRHHLNYKWLGDSNKSLNELSLDEFVRALYIGYEVKPEFKAGDWVVCESINYKGITKITRMDELRGKPACYGYWYDIKARAVYGYGESCNFAEECRHATPQEIAKEKERRWWYDLDRAPWELIEKDMLEHYGVKLEVVQVDYMKEYVLSNGKKVCRKAFSYPEYKVVCFAEDRKDA